MKKYFILFILLIPILVSAQIAPDYCVLSVNVREQPPSRGVEWEKSRRRIPVTAVAAAS